MPMDYLLLLRSAVYRTIWATVKRVLRQEARAIPEFIQQVEILFHKKKLKKNNHWHTRFEVISSDQYQIGCRIHLRN